MMINNDLIEAIAGSYTKAQLQTGYLPFLLRFFSGPDAPPLTASLQAILDKKSRNKEDLVFLATLVFSEKTLFLRFFSLLPAEVQHLYEILLWEDGLVQAERLEELYKIKIVEEKATGYTKEREIKDAFLIFSVKEQFDWRSGKIYFLSIPSGIKKAVIDYFPKPEGYYLQAVKAIPEIFTRFNAEETIFQELPRILAYENQGHIKLTNAGVPAVSTFNKMRKTLSLKEFYESAPKPYDTLRTSLIATLVAESGVEPETSDPREILYMLFHYFQHTFYPLHLLNYLKGLGYIENSYKRHVGEAFMQLLASFPEEEGWVSIENIRKSASYQTRPLEPANEGMLRSYAYYPIKEQGYTEKVPVSPYNYQVLVKTPLIKASFYLFAAFGLVEAAYAPPPEEEEEEDAWTPYDRLRYVRMTPLGAYLSGRKQNYEAPESIKTSFQLLEDSLNILSDRSDETVDLLLNNYTVKVGPSRYRTDFGVFMKGVRTAGELEAKIRLFRQTVAEAVPPNWEQFFETLRMKCDPLKSIGEHMAYQLSQNDKEMISLVAKDPVLKQLAIKAEGLIILVMKKDQAKFKNRLKEFGYLLE